MALALQELCVSADDYLKGEEISPIRHEFIAGRVYAMSGGTMAHQRIGRNFVAYSALQLNGKPCESCNSDFKVRIALGDEFAFYYPDAMIVCTPVPGDALFTDSPAVILEVISPGTRRNDEVQKFRDYVTIPSLKVYLLAECDRPAVTVYRRNGTTFKRETLVGTEAVLELPEAGIALSLADLYRDVDFREQAAGA